MERKYILMNLLKRLYTVSPIGSLENLREVALGMNYSSKEEETEVKNLVAHAHISSLNLDGRQLKFAAELFQETKNQIMLDEVLRLAKLYGLSKIVWQIHQQSPVKDFAKWFKNHGIKWVDLYLDPEENTFFFKDEDIRFIGQLISQYGSDNFWKELLASIKADSCLEPERKRLLQFLSEGKEPVTEANEYARADVDEKFRSFCKKEDLVILRKLQEGQEGPRRCSFVYLVWDKDGIVKVYKEILNYNNGPFGSIFDREDDVYRKLGENPYFPKLHDVLDVEGVPFMRQSVHFGQTLADYSGHHKLGLEDTGFIIGKVAEALAFAHSNDVAHFDVKPENILVDSSKVGMLDFGVSRSIKGDGEVDIYLADPRFGTVEGSTRLKGSKASDIFQLGLIYYLLRTGRHPFDLVPLADDPLSERQSAILRYFWPTGVLDFSDVDILGLEEEEVGLLSRMLEKDPKIRPTAQEVSKELSGASHFFISKPSQTERMKRRNIVLFPARMGIPHKGHVEYISRVLDLGYHVLISLQRSYTITNRDPIQKLLVMKMVAKSLISRGFAPEVDFSFVFTPFYKNRTEFEYHFLTMPGIEDVVAVASGNPGVHDLFSNWAIFDQESVFGTEGKKWEDLSWGEIVRQAVKKEDHETFKLYAASGVEEILSFENLRNIYGNPEIDLAESVEVVLLEDGNNVTLGLAPYLGPEKTIVSYLQSSGRRVKVVDFYCKDSLLEIDGEAFSLVYLETSFDQAKKHETISFKLEKICKALH